MTTSPWLILVHQIPPKPDYLRVKVRRRLQRIGAVALKNSVYVLPNREETAEDFEWLLAEIEAEGGTATLWESSPVDGLSDLELEALFRAGPERDYAEVATEARELTLARPHSENASGESPLLSDAARLRKRIDEIAKLDFFYAPGRSSAESTVAALETQLDSPRGNSVPPKSRIMKRQTWVTREGIFVDRMASAWLVKRFIDSEAKFKFVPSRGYKPAPGEVRFDMFRAEFTHEGENCTFETLLKHFALDGDDALVAIGQIVHDIDFKDDKFDRPQTAGVQSILRGLADTTPDDAARLEGSRHIFNGLYGELAERSPQREE
jgi:hypothetical protein